MKSSSKVVDQAVTEETDVNGYLDMKSSSEVGNTESYVATQTLMSSRSDINKTCIANYTQ